jgi:RNA polymerase sigma factor (sigma-70 family)
MDKIKFELVMNRYSKQIFNYLLKILRDREDAEDLLQEVFVAFYKKMGSVDERSYLAYLYRTAYHKALNNISSRKKSKKFMETVKKESAHQKYDQSEDKTALVKSSLQKLKPEESFILELQFFQKMSYKAIAELLETSVSAIDSKLVRAKRKLKKILAQEIKAKEVLNYRGESYEQKVRM